MNRNILLRVALAVALLASLAVDPASARRQKKKSAFEKYQTESLRDSLMSSYEEPGVVVLNRRYVTISRRGERAQAEVEHEWIFFVRDPAGVADRTVLTFDEYPGHSIKSLDVRKLDVKDEKKIDVKKASSYGCKTLNDHKTWAAEVGSVEPGDIIAVKMKSVVDGPNPIITHEFEDEFPILQSDVTFDIAREFFEGKVSAGWNWWAGSWPSYVAWRDWEKPKSWRFRWGERDIPPVAAGAEPRVVASSWLLDPRLARSMDMVPAEVQAKGGGTDMSYHGPNISAQVLSGFNAAQRTDGEIQQGSAAQPDQASFGSLTWENVASLMADRYIEKRLEKTRRFNTMIDELTDGAGSKDEIVSRLAGAVAELNTVPAPVAAGINDINRPEDIFKQGCASSVEKALLLSTMLADAGVNAYPVLLKEGRLCASLVSLEAFDNVGVVVEGVGGSRYIDADSGEIESKLPAGEWRAILTVPLDGSKPGLKIGDDLASLLR